MSNALIKEQAERMEKVRTWLVLYEPFFACLMFNLKLLPDTSHTTMATDGKYIYWNPDFAKSLSEPEIRGVFLHEILHCSGMDMLRIEGRDLFWWNVSCDYRVNLQLTEYYNSKKEMGNVRLKLPANALLDDCFKGKAPEVIYGELMKNKQLRDSLKISKGRMIGDFKEPVGGPAEKAELKDKWTQAVLQATAVCREKGDLPQFVKRMVDELLHPQQSWLVVLREFMYARVARDYSWRQINRRYASSGFILPRLDSPAMGPVVIAIDTSGSIDQDMLKIFISECEGILRDCRPERIYIISVDAAVHSEYELTSDDELPTKYEGGGGTSFIPAFNWVESKIQEGMELPACLIYFTDGEGTFPKEEPPYAVFWAITSQASTPWGTRVEINTQ